MLDKSAQYIKGVGPVRFEVLNRLGIYTVGDLINYFPRRYEDRRKFMSISKLKIGEYATVKAQVLRFNLHRSRRGLSMFKVAVGDDTGVLEVIWFNQPFMKRYFKIGQEIILYGKTERFRSLQMSSPEFEFISTDDSSLHIGRITPIYHLTSKINQRYLRTIISRVEKDCSLHFVDPLPYKLRNKLGLLPLPLALRYIHFPNDFDGRDAAYRRLVFEEFFLLQAIIALKKKKGVEKQGIVHKKEGRLIERFVKKLPFELTKGQNKAIKDIERDMCSELPMNRLLQGDVGSGKTIVATHALVLSVQSGHQAVLMAPTEILAEQHYLYLSKLLMPLNINVGIAIGSMSKPAKLNTLDEIASGKIDIVVGTHALIYEKIKLDNLGLVVIDEQHKFGLAQRSLLRKKGEIPDYLIMTATPIPRTLAMTVYGDMEISTIRELPKGRLPISTFWVKENAVCDVYKFIREEVDKGRQAYIVYPLIKESKTSEMKAAAFMHRELKAREFQNYKVGLIHGQLRAHEKEKLMRSFKQRKIDILISTTVIEVGIDIANASVMVIEHAERFGLSQLHQLRGRIGRGEHQSWCILVAEPKTEQARKRIDAMLNIADGFRLAQEDLDIRGPGRFFGPSQHGLPELKIGNILKDMQLMELAREEAFALVDRDPHLQNTQHLPMRKELIKRFQDTDIGLVSV